MAQQRPEIRFISTGDGASGGDRVTIEVAFNTGVNNSTTNYDVHVNLNITVDGESIATDALGPFDQDELVNYDVTHVFSNDGNFTLDAEIRVSYVDPQGNEDAVITVSDTVDITIGTPNFTAGEGGVGSAQSRSTLDETYSEFVRFEITSVTESDFGQPPETPIEFEYSNPAVSIDTGGNFVKHEIIGGATVRQKIGDKPLEISVDGVETEETVRKLEMLRNVQNATILSDRFAEDSMTVHIISVSTDPLEAGGAAKMTTGEMLYSYSLECVEIFNEGTGGNSDEIDSPFIPDDIQTSQ